MRGDRLPISGGVVFARNAGDAIRRVADLPSTMNRPLNRVYRRIRALLSGDWWIPCPVCGNGFSGHDAHCGEGVNHKPESYGDYSYELVCRDEACVAEAKKQTSEMRIRMRREQDF